MQFSSCKKESNAQLRSAAAAEGGDAQAEAVAEAIRCKGTSMLAALASGSSLNLSHELTVRDCCFKWKQGNAL